MSACLALLAAGCCLQVALGGDARIRPHAHHHRVKLKANKANATASHVSLTGGLALLARPFKKEFGPCPRCVRAGPREVTLYFESEGAKVEMTPEILALRGGLTLGESHAVLFPEASKLFHIGVDGVVKKTKPGAGSRFAQGLGALLEIETVPLRPRAVLSDLMPPLRSFLGELQHGPLPLGPRPQGVLYSGGRAFSRECGPLGKCHMQWTVGLELPMVPSLLELNPGSPAAGLVARARQLCDGGGRGACQPEYQAAVCLAGTVLQQAQACATTCTTPKRCMRPWLVRTHFGDIVRHAREAVGDEAIEKLPEDVLSVWGGDPDKPILPHFVDYLTFPEMAELGGFASAATSAAAAADGPRGASAAAGGGQAAASLLADGAAVGGGGGDGSGDEGEDEAGGGAGAEAALLQVARSMLDKTALVERRLASRACAFTGALTAQLTPRAWLAQMLGGRDLMSDVDSPISQKHSRSHLVFKSMGAWRMFDGDDRVHLECRTPRLCLNQRGGRTGTAEQITHVAEDMQALEASWQV